MTFLKQNKNIILASSSAVRKKILEEVNLGFSVIPPDFDEEKGKEENRHLSIKELAIFLATNKALSVSKNNPNALIIGSDQICEIDKKAIDKSKNFEEACAQLKLLQGKTHYQNNAVVILKNGKVIFKKFTKVELKLRSLSDEEIASYVKSDKPWGSAGSYKYEGVAKHLFAKIKGDYYSILGLNIQDILNFLHKKKYIKIWNSSDTN